LGRRTLSEQEGLWLVPAAMIHTLFMGFPIDAVFLDRQLCVLRVQSLVPWRLSPWVWGATSVLELAAGQGQKAQEGDILEIRECDDE